MRAMTVAMRLTMRAGAALLCLPTGACSAATTMPADLRGSWTGDRLQLVIDADGGRVESDCASGRFGAPLTATASGGFTAQGSFEVRQPGPQRADVAAAPAAAASYRGERQGVALTLTITPAAASSTAAPGMPQVYSLQQGARVKLIRCR